MSHDFLEIEHKFIVDNSFDFNNFYKRTLELKPINHFIVEVKDYYFILKNQDNYIYRYRCDQKQQTLTAKSRKIKNSQDNEVREEINILLNQSVEDQYFQVLAFLKTFGISWSGCIDKKVWVFNFNGCEVCYYEAKNSEIQNAKIFNCVEFEAKNFKNTSQALDTLNFYEKNLGFTQKTREKKSIFNLIFGEISSLSK